MHHVVNYNEIVQLSLAGRVAYVRTKLSTITCLSHADNKTMVLFETFFFEISFYNQDPVYYENLRKNCSKKKMSSQTKMSPVQKVLQNYLIRNSE